MSRRVGFAALALLLLVLSLPAAALAKPKDNRGDTFTGVADFAAYGVKSIAMLPVTSYDRNTKAEQLVMGQLGLRLKEVAFRWVSAPTAKVMLASALGDSGLKRVTGEVLAKGCLDSLSAPLVCAKLRTDAVLCVRIEQWEQQQILWNQSGRPNTTIRLSATLVDSTGVRLWGVSSSETVEGPYNDPSTSPIGMSGTSLEPKPITGQGGPPEYGEVLDRILLRWAPRFPAPTPATPAQ